MEGASLRTVTREAIRRQREAWQVPGPDRSSRRSCDGRALCLPSGSESATARVCESCADILRGGLTVDVRRAGDGWVRTLSRAAAAPNSG